MKVINNKITGNCHEITIENTFLFFKWRTTYRKINGSILRFKYPDKYYTVGLSEYCDIVELFKHLSPTN